MRALSVSFVLAILSVHTSQGNPLSGDLEGNPVTAEILEDSSPVRLSSLTCRGADEEYFPHPFDPSRFFKCIKQEPVLYMCPRNQIFHFGEETCQIREDDLVVETIGEDGSIMKKNQDDSVVETIGEDGSIRSGCSMRTFPHPFDPSKFFVCIKQEPVLYICPHNQIFHFGTETCQIREDASVVETIGEDGSIMKKNQDDLVVETIGEDGSIMKKNQDGFAVETIRENDSIMRRNQDDLVVETIGEDDSIMKRNPDDLVMGEYVRMSQGKENFHIVDIETKGLDKDTYITVTPIQEPVITVNTRKEQVTPIEKLEDIDPSIDIKISEQNADPKSAEKIPRIKHNLPEKRLPSPRRTLVHPKEFRNANRGNRNLLSHRHAYHPPRFIPAKTTSEPTIKTSTTTITSTTFTSTSSTTSKTSTTSSTTSLTTISTSTTAITSTTATSTTTSTTTISMSTTTITSTTATTSTTSTTTATTSTINPTTSTSTTTSTTTNSMSTTTITSTTSTSSTYSTTTATSTITPSTSTSTTISTTTISTSTTTISLTTATSSTTSTTTATTSTIIPTKSTTITTTSTTITPIPSTTVATTTFTSIPPPTTTSIASITSTTTNTVSSSLPPSTFSCLDAHGQYFPHPQDCSLFFLCSNGAPFLFSCPQGLHFDTRTKVCDWTIEDDAACVQTIQKK